MKNTSLDNSRRKAAAATTMKIIRRLEAAKGTKAPYTGVPYFSRIPRQTSSPTLPDHARLIANILPSKVSSGEWSQISERLEVRYLEGSPVP